MNTPYATYPIRQWTETEADIAELAEEPFDGYKTVRTIETITDDDNFVVSMYDTTPDGQEFKMMEMTYTRKQ